jgi:hypothetical protein
MTDLGKLELELVKILCNPALDIRGYLKILRSLYSQSEIIHLWHGSPMKNRVLKMPDPVLNPFS